MTYGKKKRGYREITVDGVTYRWRVGRDHRDTVTLQGPHPSGQQLIYRIRSIFVPTVWNDEGKWVMGGYVSPPGAPLSITPRFVRQVILYGLNHGWMPDKPGNAMVIYWSETQFDDGSAN